MEKKSLKEQWLTVPNILTLIRLLAIPVMCWFILQDGQSVTAFILFLAIWLTDLLDGFIARHFNQVTDVGKVLDPLVDKIFQLATGVTLWISGRLPLWVPILLFLNQFLLVLGGIFLWKNGTCVKSAWYGKLTTVLLTVCFAVLFLLQPHQYRMAGYLFILPVALSFFSTIMYARAYLFALPTEKPEDVEDGGRLQGHKQDTQDIKEKEHA